ncbi:hypothetical protein [Methylobacterium oryzae]|uniref:Uncharacterized protein n=1 Tax=Methylobacterium oryzae TaxID=334852 RepID=A0ABU7TTF7_9HYPH
MNAPDLFNFEPTVRTFPVVEVEGIRAIVERDRWCCFDAIDAGKPFPSETGFRSAGNDRPGPAEDILAAVITEQRKDKKGPFPIPATVYRQPFAGEERPQPARGAMVALRQLAASPLNVDLILAVYAKDQAGRAWGTGDPAKLVEITQRILGDGFQAESSPDGEGFAVIAPSGLRLPARGFFPAVHNLRCHVARITREATRATMPAFFPVRKRSARSAPATLFTPAE